jgi:hypothetical protein
VVAERERESDKFQLKKTRNLYGSLAAAIFCLEHIFVPYLTAIKVMAKGMKCLKWKNTFINGG